MIVVDSSVWVDFFNGRATAQTSSLLALLGKAPILVGDIVLCVLLQGARTDTHARALQRELRKFEIVTMLDANLAIAAAANYRALRSAGVTVRKTIDLIIGTYCIAHGHELLHADRDFELMEALGLKCLPARWAVHEPPG